MCKYTTLIFNVEPSPTITLRFQIRILKTFSLSRSLYKKLIIFLVPTQLSLKFILDPRYQVYWFNHFLAFIKIGYQEKGFINKLNHGICIHPLPCFLGEVQTLLQYRPHPLRPEMPKGKVYQRYDHNIDAEISFRVFDLEKDLERFTAWMNDPRSLLISGSKHGVMKSWLNSLKSGWMTHILFLLLVSLMVNHLVMLKHIG